MTTRFRGLVLSLAALAMLPLTAVLAQRGNPSVQFGGQSIDQMIAAFMAEREIPGVTLAIVQAPYISRAVGYGVTNVETKRLASPKTLWNVGQMARAYTAVAIMQLVEAGTLKMDDPVGKHVSGLPQRWQPITVTQLLAHASGTPDYATQPGFDPARPYTRAELLALVRDASPQFTADMQVMPSATDFLLLAQIVEHASGMSYEAYVTRNQIERLHLKNTLFAASLPAVKQEALDAPGAKHAAFLTERPFIDPTETATGYTGKDGALTPGRDPHASTSFGHQAIFASAEDISLWDIGLAGGLLVSAKEHRDLLYKPATIGGGIVVPVHGGWRFPKHPGLMDIEGNVPGYSCYLARFTAPTELLCVTLCGNRGGIDFTTLGRRIAGAFDPKLGPSGRAKTARESTYSVDGTKDRLESFLSSKGTANLMSSVRVWEEADGTVWAGYDDVAPSQRNAIEAAVRYATTPY
jgi:D-alanyl-D-alanine carboxypeptidase